MTWVVTVIAQYAGGGARILVGQAGTAQAATVLLCRLLHEATP